MQAGGGRRVEEKQSELNGSTRGQWRLFDSHRQRIERLLAEALPVDSPLLLRHAGPKPRLGVLGAGNCNDLDLRWLVERFSLDLVDIDADAMRQAVSRQEVETGEGLRLHAPVDLTSIADQLDEWPAGGASGEAIDRAVSCCATAPFPDLGGAFDAVLSPCVVSQLIAPVRDRLGSLHAKFPALRAAIIHRHFRFMLNLLRPGGAAIFITDVISSDTMQGLPQVPTEELWALLRSLVLRKKTFRGLDPDAIAGVLDNDSALAREVAGRQWAAPWLWHLSPRRTYLVHGLTLRKR